MINLVTWINGRPYWEQLLWYEALTSGEHSEDSLDKAFQYLLEDCQLKELSLPREQLVFTQNSSFEEESIKQIELIEIRNVKDVNALMGNQSLRFGPNLTLIYGENGSGKSGYARLLSAGCYSRGDKNILPNIRKPHNTSKSKGSAIVEIKVEDINKTIDFVDGDHVAELQRFSVFDTSSAFVHLNTAANVSFVPADLKPFEIVSRAFNTLEKKLEEEKLKRTIKNPIEGRFEGQSVISEFCKKLNSQTSMDDLASITYFQEDDDRSKEIVEELGLLRKLDIPSKKKMLQSEEYELENLLKKLSDLNDKITPNMTQEIQELVSSVISKMELSENIGVNSFNDELYLTTGSEQWKSLLRAAKTLLDHEKETNNTDNESQYCPLCLQHLSEKEHTLFQQYWKFLEGKAEHELREAKSAVAKKVQFLSCEIPELPDHIPSSRILLEKNPDYIILIRQQLQTYKQVIEELKLKLSQLDMNNIPQLSPVFVETLRVIIEQIKAESNGLTDPSDKIKKLEDELILNNHRKLFIGLKPEIIKYLGSLKWLESAKRVNFPKKQVTAKQRELFDQIVTEEYKNKFAEECRKLDCDFGIKVNTKGEKGSTVKELILDFSATHKPGKILSEGEQRVCALSDFLTEVSLNKKNAGIIFDDPVTSLDHLRKRNIAERLVEEAKSRQVIIFTHDKVFLSYLVEIADQKVVSFVSHWIQKIGLDTGKIYLNNSPKLAALGSIVTNIDSLLVEAGILDKQSEQQSKLMECFSLLRSGCEAIIEQILFNGTVRRHEDYIRVGNLEAVPWDEALAAKIVELHGKLSRYIDAHNRSDLMREEPLTIELFKTYRKEFIELRDELNSNKKAKEKLKEKLRKSNSSPW